MRILIVEDEPQIGELVKSGLESECFIVDLVADGEQGLTNALTNDYDIVILDNVLPKRSGLEICQEIRRRGKTVPILVLSVKSEVGMKVQLLNAGADDYLTKPFSFQELLARIRVLMRRPTGLQQDSFLEVDDLKLDIKNHIAYRGEDIISLTRKEFVLLEYLMRNAGNIVSRGMILEHVWDMSVDPFSNTIEVHVANLRKKIDTQGKKKTILTISGQGYTLVCLKKKERGKKEIEDHPPQPKKRYAALI